MEGKYTPSRDAPATVSDQSSKLLLGFHIPQKSQQLYFPLAKWFQPQLYKTKKNKTRKKKKYSSNIDNAFEEYKFLTNIND